MSLLSRGRRLVVLFALIGPLFACSGSEGPSEPADDPSDDDSPDVQLVTLEVTVRLNSDFREVGDELGWGGAAVPDALVTVRRLGSQSVDSLEADVNGVAVFDELLEGNYTISAVRILDPSERARLSEDYADINVLGAATTTQLQPASEDRTLDVRGGKRGSLLLSEMFAFPLDHPGGAYQYAGFLELYNNGDTLAYLDGLIVGGAWPRSVNAGQWPCTDYEFFTSDPDGIWAEIFFQFPGSGTSYPLAPGETAVLATDAIDHSEFVEGAPDLAQADFEFLGRNDVDNPAVPNLVSIGTQVDRVNHGVLALHSHEAVPFLARAVDVESLPRRTIVIQTENEYVRIPKEALIDLGQFIWFGGSPVCDRLVHPSLDQAVGGIEFNDLLSIQRRVLYETGDGQAVLQDTDNSDRDFENVIRTPGTIGG